MFPLPRFQALVSGEIHHLLGRGAIGAWHHADIGRVQPVVLANFFEVQRFRFFAFADNQDAFVAGAVGFLARQCPSLAFLGLIIAPHRVSYDTRSRKKGSAPNRPKR